MMFGMLPRQNVSPFSNEEFGQYRSHFHPMQEIWLVWLTDKNNEIMNTLFYVIV